MKRFGVSALALIVGALGLTGCEATTRERLVNLNDTGRMQTNAERNASESAADDAACRQYGALPGTDAYTNCRLQMAQMRQQRRIAHEQAVAVMMQGMDAEMAATAQANAAAMQANANAAAAAPMPNLLAGSQHCTTTFFGNQAQTNCH
jgi:hypothetical protein